jgi:exopolysaccharide biosynthesis polyprenyl glycosylphosphotransferase
MINKSKNQDKTLLEILDVICIIISFIIAYGLRFGFKEAGFFNTQYGFIFVLIILSYLCIFNTNDFYSGIFKRGFFKEFVSVFNQNVLLALLTSGILFILQKSANYSRIFFACFFSFNILITYIVRQYFKIILLAYFKKSRSSLKTMIITTSEQAQSIITKLRSERLWEYEITGLGIVDKDIVGEYLCGIEVKSNWDNLLNVITKDVVDEVFISIPYDGTMELNETVLALENMGITVNLSIATFELNIQEKTITYFGDYPVLTFSTRVFNKGSLILKRCIDILGSIVGLIITVIVGIFVAPAILIESPGPLIFSQTRVGKNGRRFKIYKFRSMYADAEERKVALLGQNEMDGFMFKMTNDPRVTKVGKFIRKTSIDELPQFFNVLRGDMSLVGTRPPTEDEFLHYESRHKRRLSLKPGITGLWQVSGRSDIDNFEDVVKMDLDYIDEWSVLLDIKLMLKTVYVVLFRVGAK